MADVTLELTYAERETLNRVLGYAEPRIQEPDRAAYQSLRIKLSRTRCSAGGCEYCDPGAYAWKYDQ